MNPSELEEESSADFTLHQEKIHASLHILGVVFGLFAVPFLLHSAIDKDAYLLYCLCIYGACFLMVFTFSTLYHSTTDYKLKRTFKKLDRISIYFLIAGTYTPIVKFYLFDTVGIILLTTLWCLAMLGILFEVYFPDRYPAISMSFYLFMGLIFVFVPFHFFALMPVHIIMLLLSGVSLYFIGVFFYVWQRWEYHHAVWHIFVLSGSICHYMAMLYALK